MRTRPGHTRWLIATAVAVVLGLCTPETGAQTNVELKVQLLTADLIGEVNLDMEPFAAWVKTLSAAVEPSVAGITDAADVLVVVTVHRQEPPTIRINTRPRLNPATVNALMTKLCADRSVRTKLVDYSFALVLALNGGCTDTDLEFTPPIESPYEQRLAAFEKLDLAGKRKELQRWITEEVLPVVAAHETSVDPKFEGVLAIGRIVQQKQYLSKPVDTLTIRNPDYWRAVVEMSPGNQLIPFTRVCMLIAAGDLDMASRLLMIVNAFSAESTLPLVYREELARYLGMFQTDLSARMQAGIKLHDEGKFQEAIAHYRNVLRAHPKSAWTIYELYYSGSMEMKDEDKQTAAWQQARAAIYKCDPMYHMDVRARSGLEGYLLFRRLEIQSLFKDGSDFKKDILAYADIALDLGEYGLAGQLYWLIFSGFPGEDIVQRDMLVRFLYCIGKLGDKVIVQQFKGDFPAEFKKLEAARRQLMLDSPIYNAFEKKEPGSTTTPPSPSAP